MTTTLRWEVCALLEPWAFPHASVLGPPIASGTIVREGETTNAPNDAFFAASDAIVVPPAVDDARSYHLALEVFGSRGWIIAIGTPDAPPQAGDGIDHTTDPNPCVFVPPSGLNGSGRSREVRAIRPGSVFIAQPSRT